MINKAWKFQLAVMSALLFTTISVRSQVSTAAPEDRLTTRSRNQDDQPRMERRRRSDNDNNRKEGHTRDQRDAEYRRKSGEFRKVMQEELDNVPALDKRMDRLMNIQAQRSELQEKRQEVAVDEAGDREAIIKRFHSLLRRDLHLSDETRRIVGDIVADMPRIKKQLKQRRTTLEMELDAKLNDGSTTVTGTEVSSQQAREIRRRINYVDFLDKKLSDLVTHPERLDLLARVLRGLPIDETKAPEERDTRTKPSSEQSTRAQITKLQGERKALQRELRQMEKKIEDIRDGGGTSEEPRSNLNSL